VVQDNRSGVRRTLRAHALFIFIGAQANTGWLEGAVELDDRGFVLTGRDVDRAAPKGNRRQRPSREPYLLETSPLGVFAAGDVLSGSTKRAASAVGEGAEDQGTDASGRGSKRTGLLELAWSPARPCGRSCASRTRRT
jgi:thioredoxin reductase (NADPH)